MGSKDKSLKETFTNIFKRSKAGNLGGRSEYIYLNEETLKNLSRESPISTRIKVLKDLCLKVSDSRLEHHAVEKLWSAIVDLFDQEQTTETRHVAFQFLQSLIKGQNDKLEIMRAHFFRFIKLHDNPNDVGQRLELLNTLTTNGKYILYFEEEVGPFVLNWLPDIIKAGKTEEYLVTINNLIKFNAAYLDDEVMTGLIHCVCELCYTSHYKTVILCLQIMSSVVAYSNMSPNSLSKFIEALCRTVDREEYCMSSWKIMKTLLGTHMGHSGLYTMCQIVQNPVLSPDTKLIRGAIFFIHMSLWGSAPLPNLHCPPNSVLPSFLHAVKSNQLEVAYEIILGIQQLVLRHGSDLQKPTWIVLLDIVSYIVNNIEPSPLLPNMGIFNKLHETLTNIENLLEIGSFNGSFSQYFTIIEECAADRPESSILRLIGHLSQSINPTEHLWLTNLYNLLQKYFKPNIRTNIRLKVLDVLTHVVKLNRRQYEEELIDRIVIPHMLNIFQNTDIVIRSSVANLLVDLCMECESKKCLELLEILEKLLLRPYEMHSNENYSAIETDFSDTKCVVKGLIDVFIHKLYRLPSSHAIKIYHMLVTFLEMHYARPKIFENYHGARKMIFECFLKMRADSMYHLGYPIKDKLKFSPYLGVVFGSLNRGPLGTPPPASPAPSQQPFCTVSYVSLKKVFKVFITCLKFEKDWEVLSLVLSEMTKVLQNKSLILSKQGNNELDLLVNVLCAMLTDRSLNLPETLNVKVSKPDFHSSVLLVLVHLSSYHNYLDQIHQQKLIRCLMMCTNTAGSRTSNSLKHCISALTICTMEMKDAMVKMLPDVLLNLSQKSATVHIAIPVLEFLSTLTQLPMVYSNFVADQYMALFAIALPYTNPFKYNHYIVSLAHHVIAVWFLKCRLPFRKEFVKFITDGLQTNVLVPFGEETRTIFANVNVSELNQDSSDRKRSSSLTEQGSRRQTTNLSSARMDKTLVHKPNAEKSLTMTFYEELTETCLDLMARYAYSPCSAIPKRLPAAEFLLNGGQSMSWLVGNKLVTVTTSGCSQKVLKNGLCDKCWVNCRAQSESRQSKSARSGSNDTDELGWASRQNSNDKSNNTSISSPSETDKKVGHKLELVSSKLQQLANVPKQEVETCACWCSEWAEVYIRRPTGNTSWVMRIQNYVSFSNSIYEFPLNEISTLFMPTLNPDSRNPSRPPLRRQSSEDHPPPEEEKEKTKAKVSSLPGSPKQSTSRQNSRDSVDEEVEYIYDDGTKSRNPVRRSNSSPEMSASWKNPFLHQKVGDGGEDNQTVDDDSGKKNKVYTKDLRVSCEAIPEEIAGLGTTPPSGDPVQPKPSQQSATHLSDHPVLLSCHSYPGSSPPKENIAPKLYKTVPPTPNITSAGYHQPEFSRRPTNLPALGNLGPLVLTTKPPQSPTQTSPRLPRHSIGHEIQKSSSSSLLERTTSNMNLNLARERARERKNSGSVERLSSVDPNQSQKRERVHTISVMQNNRKPRSDFTRQSTTRSKEIPKSGINPSFIFLQLFHAACFGQRDEKPMLVSNAESVQRAVKILDLIPPYETHQIGIIYVREGQTKSEVEILKNRFGSMRYVEYLQNLATLVKLEDVDPQIFFLGGLDKDGSDGKFAYIWQDDIIKVLFYVATLMPNKESDPACTNKKRHIGNNYVNIVYNDSGEEYALGTIKGQFNFASIIIEPLDYNFNRVIVKVKDELAKLLPPSEPKLVSDQNLPILTRQLALHANLASLVAQSLKNQLSDPYASNWLERLRKIKNVRTKILQDLKNDESLFPGEDIYKSKKHMDDFTEYT